MEFTSRGFNSRAFYAHVKACFHLLFILQARNLDYEWGGRLRDALFMANFVKGGTVMFTTVSIPGYVGTFNGQKSGAYAVDVNERDKGVAWNNIWAMVEKLIIAWLNRVLSRPQKVGVKNLQLGHSTST